MRTLLRSLRFLHPRRSSSLVLLAIAVTALFAPQAPAAHAGSTSSTSVWSLSPSNPTLVIDATQQFTLLVNGTPSGSQQAAYSSSNPAVVTVSGRVAQAVGPGTATITAYNSGNVASTRVWVPNPPASTSPWSLSPSNSTLVFGTTQQFTLLSDGAAIGAQNYVNYTSTNPAVVTISGRIAQAVGPGTAKIYADYSGNWAVTTVTVPSPPGILDPVDVTLRPYTSQQFRLRVTTASGTLQDVTSQAIWTLSNGAVATVNRGLVTATRPGTTQLQGSYNGLSFTTTVTVDGPWWTISPTNPTLAIGRPQQLTLLVDGIALGPQESVTYSSSNPAVAKVSGRLVTAVGAGTATIRADFAGNKAFMTVTGAVIYTLSPSNPIVYRRQTQQLTMLEYGRPLDARLATWSSSNAAVATVSSTGVVTGVGDGQATITATFKDAPARTTVLVCREGYC